MSFYIFSAVLVISAYCALLGATYIGYAIGEQQADKRGRVHARSLRHANFA